MFHAHFQKTTLRKQILLVYIPLLLLSVLLIILFINSTNEQSKRQEAYYQLENSTDVMCLLLEDRIEGALSTFVSIEESGAFSKLLLNSHYRRDAEISYDDRIKMGNMLDDIYGQYFNIIDSVYIQVNGAEFVMMKRHYPLYASQDMETLFSTYGCISGQYLWEAPHTDDIFYSTQRDVFTLRKFFGNPNSDTGLLGTIVLNINLNYIMQLLKNMPISKSGYWVLIADGQLFTLDIMADQHPLPDGAVSFLMENCGRRGHFETHSTDGKPLYVHFDGLGKNGWGIAAVMPTSEMQFATAPLQYETLFLIILVVVFMLLCAVLFANTISQSLQELSRRMEAFDRSALPENLPQVQFHLDGCKEVTLLSDTLDDMIQTIDRLVKEVCIKQAQLRKIELAALQEQIKPHFIYNALSTILYEIDSGRNKQAGEMLRSLITFFRLSVNRGDEVSTVANEIAHIDSYLRIQQLRQCCVFDYFIQLDEDLNECEILKFTLQPLVENCFVHGFRREGISPRSGNVINISIGQMQDNIVFEILDNGVGIESDVLAHLNNEIHESYDTASSITYGIKNVDLRIRLKYGPQYGITVDSESGVYTLVKVTVPLRRLSAV